MALAEYPSGGTANSGTYNQKFKSSSGKPFTEPARDLAARKKQNQHDPKLSFGASHATAETSTSSHLDIGISSLPAAAEESNEVVGQQRLDHRERRERELKFTAAGWKRGCHGKWYKDENVSCLL